MVIYLLAFWLAYVLYHHVLFPITFSVLKTQFDDTLYIVIAMYAT